MRNNPTEMLSEQLEEMMLELLAANCRAVADSLDKRGKTGKRVAAKSARRQQRSREEIQTLEEKVVSSVTKTPGQGIAEVAQSIGAETVQLYGLLERLRTRGKIRGAGVKRFMKYYPL